jgi:hypothetical protein
MPKRRDHGAGNESEIETTDEAGLNVLSLSFEMARIMKELLHVAVRDWQ